MSFENGVKAILTVTGFTDKLGRRMIFHGTKGSVELNETNETLTVTEFGTRETVYNLADLVRDLGEDAFGHGGGDKKIIDALYDSLVCDKEAETNLEQSAESHFMALAAEKSRKEKTVVYLKDFR